eukprot:scaffold76106_cov17-Tisochrysis_lutea.AAC.1
MERMWHATTALWSSKTSSFSKDGEAWLKKPEGAKMRSQSAQSLGLDSPNTITLRDMKEGEHEAQAH